MPSTSLLYRAMAQAAVPTAGAILHFSRHRAAHQARLDAPEAMRGWARAHRDPNRPLIWFHAPSVGEGLQARAVIRELRSMLPHVQVIYTHYSSSARAFAATTGTDWQGYLSYDRRADVDRMFVAAAPDLLVLTKLDLWPELAVRAATHGARLAMIAATVSPHSLRLQWPSRGLTRPGYAAVDLAAAVDQRSAELLAELGTDPRHITVTGDPRIDSVLDVVDSAPAGSAMSLDPARTMVAGSTWPGDELVILEAMVQVRRTHPDAQLLIVPHQPIATHLDRLARSTKQFGLPDPVRFSALTTGMHPSIVMVDGTGMLAQLYRYGVLAYVGGGFGGRGIHSVFEPAAWGKPMVIGPNDRDSPDAALLARAGALTRLPKHESANALAALWGRWLDDADNARASGRRGREALTAQRGAAHRTAALLAPLCSKE